MWLCISFCLVLLKTTLASGSEEVITSSQEFEAKFVDVIKNISRVNVILQDLIKNYEHVQKLYKTQETFEESYSSDSEIDELFKAAASKYQKYELVRSRRNQSTPRPFDRYQYVTQMIVSEEETVSREDEYTTKKHKIVDQRLVPNVERLEAKDITVESESKSDDDNDRSTSNKQDKNVSMQSEIFVDTHKNEKKKNSDSPNKVLDVKIDNHAFNKTKTRYSKVNNKNNEKTALRGKQINNKFIVPILRYRSESKPVKKIVYAEKFPQKSIWKDIINNKPIKLEVHDEIASKEKSVNFKGEKSPKTALVFLTDKNKKKNENNKETSLEEDEVIMKEQYKANILREAYGDACMKLVLRKCHKACKQVIKITCRRTKCKSGFKEDFRSQSKTGCIKEFKSNGRVMKFRGADGSKSDGFVDLTRNGYAATCLPGMGQSSFSIQPIQNTIGLRNETPTEHHTQLNILRDRYERACSKASSKKCQSACNHGYRTACDKYDCSNHRKKSLKKECKKQCNRAYNVKQSDSESRSERSSESDSFSE